MDFLRKYLLSIIGMSLLLGIISDIAKKTSFQKQIGTICALIMTLVYLEPVFQTFRLEWPVAMNSDIIETKDLIAKGEDYYEKSLSSIIKKETEEYIQSVACSVGADITAQVKIAPGTPPVPDYVTIYGSFDETSEKEISNVLLELGIPKEHQTWIRQEKYESGSS